MKIKQMLRALHYLLILCCVSQLAAGVRVLVVPEGDRGLVSTQLGGTVSLSCMVEEAHTEEELQWSRNGMLIDLGHDNRINQSRLCVQDITRDDHHVNFTCQLRRDANILASAQINVHFPPDLSGTEKVTMEEKRETVLSCTVHANPQVTVSWLLNGTGLDLMTSGYTLYQDGRETRLTIGKTQRHLHEGLYRCVTKSSEYGERTKSFQLIVEEMKMAFPLGPVIAGCFVVLCTMVLAIVSRWSRISKCCKQGRM